MLLPIETGQVKGSRTAYSKVRNSVNSLADGKGKEKEALTCKKRRHHHDMEIERTNVMGTRGS